MPDNGFSLSKALERKDVESDDDNVSMSQYHRNVAGTDNYFNATRANLNNQGRHLQEASFHGTAQSEDSGKSEGKSSENGEENGEDEEEGERREGGQTEDEEEEDPGDVAIIHFKPDGTILWANDLFLGAMGYALEEIQGGHHSMFVFPEDQGPAYKRFWEALANGERQDRIFRRITKSKQEIYIDAVYMPKFDGNGNVHKVIKHVRLSDKDDTADIGIIHFEIDGTIIKANKLFLAAMGYTLQEISGKHHSMFMSPDEVNDEYKQFWADLRAGITQEKIFRRKTKSGKDIWIDATYMPQKDPNGKVFKVIKHVRPFSDDNFSDMKASLNRVIRNGTKRENVGTLAYDNVLKLVTDSEYFTNRGKAVLGRAFFDMLAHIIAFTKDQEFAEDCMPWLALRHIQYHVPLDSLSIVRQALLGAMEQLSGDMWNAKLENIWGTSTDRVATMLVSEIIRMQNRLKTLNDDWKIVTEQLGLEALSAKMSANLVVTSMHSAASNTKNKKGTSSNNTGGLATDIVSLVEFLIGAVQDLNQLRSAIFVIGVPWNEIFKNYKSVPNLARITGVVLSTMHEVVGTEWDIRHEEAWNWLWELAVSERNQRWTSQDRDLVFQAYQTVEACLLAKLEAEAPPVTGNGDFYAGNEAGANGDHKGEGGGDKDDKSDMKSQVQSDKRATTVRTLDTGVGCCGFRKQTQSSAESAVNTVVSKTERRKALQSKLDSAPKVNPLVVQAIVTEFFSVVQQAPTIGQVFNKNRELYDKLFQSIIERFIAYVDYPDQIWEEDPELALRHINFGVLPADLKLFAGIYLQCFANIAGALWKPEYQAAWVKYFNIAATGLCDSIIGGLSPQTKALVIGNNKDLADALKTAPRGKRSQLACEVVIQGKVKSPIYLMIEWGRLQLAETLLKDCLGIRANRSGVHYGKDTLWSVHGGDLIKVLCEEAPDLVSVLLDGHVWCSDLVIGGRKKVIFYVHELWGDLQYETEDGQPLFSKPSEFPISRIVALNRPTLAAHPVVDYIVNSKWKLFAGKRYLLHRGMYFLGAIFFTLGYEWLAADDSVLSFVFRVLGMFVIFVGFFFENRTIYMHAKNDYFIPQTSIPYALKSVWTWWNFIIFMLYSFVFFVELGDGGITRMQNGERKSVELSFAPESNPKSLISGITAVFLWASLIQILQSIPSVMKLIVLTKFMAKKLLQYAVILGLIVFAFSCVLYLMGLSTAHFSHWDLTLLAVLSFLGNGWRPDFVHEFTSDVLRVYIMVYLVLVYLLLLSILLAVFVETARRMNEVAEQEAALAKAEMVASIENSCTHQFLNKINSEINFNDDVTFDDELEKSPKGGLVDYKPASFHSPGFEQRGIDDRIERYDSEEGPETPWPLETIAMGASGMQNATDQALIVVCGAVETLEKSVKSVTTLMQRIQRTLRNAKDVGDDTKSSNME